MFDYQVEASRDKLYVDVGKLHDSVSCQSRKVGNQDNKIRSMYYLHRNLPRVQF